MDKKLVTGLLLAGLWVLPAWSAEIPAAWQSCWIDSQCSDRLCQILLDSVVYSERIPLLSVNWRQEYKDKQGLK